MSGTVLSEHPVDVTEEQIIEAVNHFKGDYDQIPPMYSAIKVEGRKLYELAREGIVIERKPRPVEIYSIDAHKVADDVYSMRVACSKGTYIRTLCSDIGKALGCGAAMQSLVRTRTGQFTLGDCVTIEELDNMTFEERLTLPKPVESLFADLPEVVIPEYYVKLVRGGTSLYQKKLKVSFDDGQLIRLKNRGEFLALGRAETDEDGKAVIRPEKLFSLGDEKSAGGAAE
jgi:tRNA pseudouridine55 synthase